MSLSDPQPRRPLCPSLGESGHSPGGFLQSGAPSHMLGAPDPVHSTPPHGSGLMAKDLAHGLRPVCLSVFCL